MNRLLFLLVTTCSLSFQTSVHAQDSAIKKKLIGSWIYFGLEAPADYPSLSKEQEKANEMNRGLIITFFANGRYQVWHKVDGKKEVLARGETKLSNKGKHLVIEGLEGDIHALSNDYLKFSAPDKPLLIFKKYME